MNIEHECYANICSDCFEELAEGLWITYYEQYLTAVSVLNKKNNADNQLLLPTVFMLAQYIEIWIKTIAANYATGKCDRIETEELRGHNIDNLIQSLVKIISDSEWERNKKKIREIDEELRWFIDMPDNGELLSIAMRYPVTTQRKPSVNPCLFTHLSGECYKFDYDTCCKKINRILDLTYEVYDDIYSSRI